MKDDCCDCNDDEVGIISDCELKDDCKDDEGVDDSDWNNDEGIWDDCNEFVE